MTIPVPLELGQVSDPYARRAFEQLALNGGGGSGGGGATPAATRPKLSTVIPALSPRSWWKLEEPTVQFVDSGPAGINAGINAKQQVSVSPGPDGYSKAVRTNTNQGGSVCTFGNNYGFAGTLPFTFVLFHRPENIGTQTRRALQKNDSTSGPFLGITPTGQLLGARFGGAVITMASDTVQLNDWNMYALRYDSANLTVRLNWVANTVVDSGSMAASAPFLRLHGEPGDSTGWGCDGYYSNLCVWDRALTNAELDSLWECVT